MFKGINKIIFLVTILIMLIGLATIYSSTFQKGQNPSSTIFIKQVNWFVVGIIMLLVAANFNYHRLYDLAYFLYGFTILLLLIVLVLGREVLGAQRWLELGGLNFQPSELGKLAIIAVLARQLSQKNEFSNFGFSDKLNNFFKQLVLPFVLVAIPAGLVFLQPDLGTAVLYLFVFGMLLLVSEVPISYFLIPVITGLCVSPFFWHFLKDYQKDRLRVFLNPNIDPLGAGYTIIQSKIAIGSGRLLGKGWLAGTQSQLSFLPERHTDFIFGVLGEEAGFLGSIIFILLFYTLIHYALRIAEQTNDRFGSLLASGIAIILAFQAVINLAMTIGICPVVGLVLPFVSYGGSSLVIFAILIGILMNINKKRMVF
ncbi:MAG: rod shape-determining protein RodA [Candidatus Omnitrophota bacterium]|nr:rod shape-determining protein RodA [Candidatus Omnitrophota bacterium]